MDYLSIGYQSEINTVKALATDYADERGSSEKTRRIGSCQAFHLQSAFIREIRGKNILRSALMATQIAPALAGSKFSTGVFVLGAILGRVRRLPQFRPQADGAGAAR